MRPSGPQSLKYVLSGPLAKSVLISATNQHTGSMFINQHYVCLVKCESMTQSWANKYLKAYKVKDQTHSFLKKFLTRMG